MERCVSGAGAGIFGDVDTLRDLAETAMNKTVDKMLTDSEFIKSLSSSGGGEVNIRLGKLDALYKDGLITEEEYIDNRNKIISDIWNMRALSLGPGCNYNYI